MSDTPPELAAGLDVHEVDDGLVVYDLGTDRVHYLNPTAAVIVGLCDGTRTEDEVAALVQDAWSLAARPSREVRDCIAKLRGEGVLR